MIGEILVGVLIVAGLVALIYTLAVTRVANLKKENNLLRRQLNIAERGLIKASNNNVDALDALNDIDLLNRKELE